MGKALLVRSAATPGNGQFAIALGAGAAVATESETKIKASEAFTLSALRTNIVSGGSGDNTLRLRKNGSNGNLVAARTGTGKASDLVNSDSISADDEINLQSTDTGTSPNYQTTTMEIVMASGHGCLHSYGGAAANLNTGFAPISGNVVNIIGTEVPRQLRNRAYTSWEAFQVNVTANTRTSNTIVRMRVNGENGAGSITIPAGQTGIFTATGVGQALSPGDLINYGITRESGSGSITFSVIAGTFKSSTGRSELLITGSGTRSASDTANYYPLGGSTANITTESDVQITIGFKARASHLRCYLGSNSYTADAQLNFRVNGVTRLTVTLTAGGGAGWYENASAFFDLNDGDEICAEIVGGSSGSITLHSIAVTLNQPQPARTMALNRMRRAA